MGTLAPAPCRGNPGGHATPSSLSESVRPRALGHPSGIRHLLWTTNRNRAIVMSSGGLVA
jgi:hypothetical protein